MDIELVSAETDDAVRLDGAWRRPQRSGASSLGLDAVIFHHGVGGNFYNPSFVDRVGDALLAEGCAVLRVNNRGHDLAYGTPRGRLGAAYETVDDCRRDWKAWLDLAGRLGYSRIGLWGHSLGAVKTVYYLATERDPRVVCAVATSPPRFSFETCLGMEDGDEFRGCYEQARVLLDRGEPERLLSVTAPTPLLISARTYVDKYGPGARYNILDHVANVPVPLLVTVGGLEGGLSFGGLAEELRRVTAAAPRLTFELVDGADHQYAGRVDALRQIAFRWLATFGNRTAVQPTS